ncbi:gas vesicle protein GvpJ [Streptomyces sp. bgisy153]
MLTGDLVLSIADIDLVRVSLRALVMSVREDAPDLLPPMDDHDAPP